MSRAAIYLAAAFLLAASLACGSATPSDSSIETAIARTQIAGGAPPPRISTEEATEAPAGETSESEEPEQLTSPTEPTALPSATVLPTDTPLPSPTPEPVSFQGTGQDVTDRFTLGPGFYRAAIETSSTGYFGVKVYDATGNEDLLVNAIAPYQGVRPLFGPGDFFFEVDADGAWTITVEAAPPEPDAVTSLSGRGDHVSGLFTPPSGPATYTFTHDGDAYFGIFAQCAGGREMAQNEIGIVNNTTVVRFDEGPCVWEVVANGNWTIRAEE
jgi:hypothetical protein